MANMNKGMSKSIIVIKTVGQSFFFYGLLGWVYGVLVQLIHPSWLVLGLSHLVPWVRVDTFAVLSFVMSGLGFLTWRLISELNTQDTRLGNAGAR